MSGKSPEHVSVNIFEQINVICKEFRQECREGVEPDMAEWLRRVPESSRANLLQNLLDIEVNYRRSRGSTPSSDEYVVRFPQFARLIRRAFFEDTMMSKIDPLQDTPAIDSADFASPDANFDSLLHQTGTFGSTESPAARRIGDYELIQELGRGGMGVVYEALHLQRRNFVALKTLPTGGDGQQVNADRLHRFRREFRNLSEINHPNLVGMQTLEVDGGQWFFTMDLIDGVDFLSFVRPGGKLDESRLRESLKQLVRGVVALHDQRILHRDLKPSNVLISNDGHVSILDFGLVAELEQGTDRTASMQTQQFAGTPRYSAPEQVVGQRSPANDWYALGTMMFEALTGEPPFRGSASELLIKKREQDPPLISQRSDLPRDLSALTDELLRREPDLRPDAKAIAEVLSMDLDSAVMGTDELSTDGPVQTEYDRQSLIGREHQLSQLESIKDQFLSNRQPTVVWISGLSGEGKSVLAEKFLEPLRRSAGIVVLSGRCYDRESVPYKAIDVLIEALVGLLKSRQQVDDFLPKDIQMLAQLFPALKRVEAVELLSRKGIGNIDDRQIRYRAFYALREMLTRICRATPLIVFVDDLQWGDADSSEVLFDLLSPPDPPSVFFLGSYRSDEADQSPFLQEWTRRCRENSSLFGSKVEVAPLTENQCLQYMANRLGIDSDELREQANTTFANTKGNPYFLEQLIEGFDLETRQFKPVPLNDIIRKKLVQLPKESAELLKVVAIAGQVVSIEEASTVAGFGKPLFSTFTHMRSERLVRLIGAEDQQLVDTYHDKIRETVIQTLSDSERRITHKKFAEFIEGAERIDSEQLLQCLSENVETQESLPAISSRIYDIAYHYHEADDPRAFPYQLMAGELSFRAYASEEAVDSLRRAIQFAPESTTSSINYRLHHRLASSLARLKLFDEALEEFEVSLRYASDDLTRASSYLGIATIYEAQGRYQDANKSFDQTLKELGRARPGPIRSALALLPLSLKTFLGSKATTTIPSAEERARLRLEQDVYLGISGWIFEQASASIVDYPYSVMKLGVLSLKFVDASRYAMGLSTTAFTVAVNGWPNGGKRLLKKVTRNTGQFEDIKAQGQYLLATAIILANAKELHQADSYFDQSEPLLDKSGSHVFGVVGAHLHRHTHTYIGTTSEEMRSASRVLAVAEGTGDVRGQCWGHYDIAAVHARRGELAPALARLRTAERFLKLAEIELSETIFLGTCGYVLMQSSHYSRAREFVERSWQLILQRKLLMEYTIRTLPYLIEVMIGPNWINSNPASQQKRLLSRRCRTSKWIGWFYPNLRSPASRLRGRAYWQLGKLKKSRQNFRDAIQAARSLGTKYDLARSLLDLANVDESNREENRAEAIRLLKEMESVIPRAESWLLGDQYDEFVVAPEFDLEAWENEHGKLIVETA